ncbi:lysosomal acid phosphatase-like [Homalodisca vitripennis]|uniref:lysosomal acid phosphatase-like n=1 Tax=Homalodisca vitripennis TaxID=197043 RepID=UPI001EEBB55A|nr:lysosomal acid phosphatase-like [Homalodisca vitripennis]
MPYPNDPNKSKYPEVFPGIPGKLTEVGQQEMYRVGKNYKARYGDFVGGYTQEKVHVSTTSFTTRTTVTALCVMAGQFPPSKPIFKDLPNWQPIPVWQNSSDFDKSYLYGGDLQLTKQVCPRLGTLVSKGLEEAGKPDQTRDRQTLYKLLQNYTGDPKANSVLSAAALYDVCTFESWNGLQLPAWATQPLVQYQNRRIYPDLLEPIALEFFFDLIYLNHNKNNLQYYSGPLFNYIHEQLEMNKKDSEEKYRFHATHDSTLFALLEGMDIEVERLIGPGDGIIFELCLKNNTTIVQVLYYHANKQTFRKLKLPSCPAPCTLSNFIKATPGLTPQQWEERCHM